MSPHRQSATVVEDATTQANGIVAAARMAHERGYALILHGWNKDAAAPDLPYSLFASSIEQWLTLAMKRHCRRVVLVSVFPADDRSRDAGRTDLKPFDHPVRFSVRLPKVREWLPINTAIELMCERPEKVSKQGGGGYRRKQPDTMPFSARPMSDCIEYRGGSRAALETLLSIFSVAHHRAIMTREQL